MVTVQRNVLPHQFYPTGRMVPEVAFHPHQAHLIFPSTPFFLCGLQPPAPSALPYNGSLLHFLHSTQPIQPSCSPLAAAPRSSPAVEIEPERPIGQGSFGVVWAVRNPRSGEKAALKKIPNVFQSQLACIRALREIKVLCEFRHDNLLSADDVLQPSQQLLTDVYVLSELMESDLHQIIVSPQQLSEGHIKIFLYQVLRGVKYLHTAGVIHRDLKPGNILVNSNCRVKICDFGFARAVDPNQRKAMTMEVVTQYYRAPELLAGCYHYGVEIDMWSVGCIFAELLGRRILFEAATPLLQLDMITELLGSPSREDATSIVSTTALKHLFAKSKPCNLHRLYGLSCHATHEAVHLLSEMLKFSPQSRLTAAEALCHPYLEDGRLRYHTTLCSCCHTANGNLRRFCNDLEPSSPSKFNTQHEKDMTDLHKARAALMAYITSVTNSKSPLFINTNAERFQLFTKCVLDKTPERTASPSLWP